MQDLRKTKIVCTIGPSSNSREILKKLILAGMDVARLNFSHGTHEEHRKVIELIREIASELGTSVAILQDLCGPKIRVGDIEKAPVMLKKGELFTLTSELRTGDSRGAHVSYENLSDEVIPGTRILIDDGLMELKVEKVEHPQVICRIITGGLLNSHKGVNFPDIELKIPAMTEKDKDDLLFGISQDVDLVALSFVQRPEDIYQIKEIIHQSGKVIPVIAKIEKGEALKHLEEITDISDGLMVARGDLGVETPIERLPLEQKHMISLCRKRGKPVITATQMMDSMIRNPRPTNAEVTDVANAILDGTDAVMLSGETASGLYPVEAVKAMSKIALTAEQALPYDKILTEESSGKGILEVISRSACEMAEELKASAIIVSTSSGRSAKKTSLYRPRAPILALTDRETIARQLRLSWGVFPVVMKCGEDTDTDEFMNMATERVISSGIVKEGDLVVITAGYPAGGTGSTNTLQVHVLGHMFLRGKGLGKAQLITGKLKFILTPGEIDDLTKGTILGVKNLTEKYRNILPNLSGLIIADENISPEDYTFISNSGIPVLIGVPGVFKAFNSGEKVTIDTGRGIIYK